MNIKVPSFDSTLMVVRGWNIDAFDMATNFSDCQQSARTFNAALPYFVAPHSILLRRLLLSCLVSTRYPWLHSSDRTGTRILSHPCYCCCSCFMIQPHSARQAWDQTIWKICYLDDCSRPRGENECTLPDLSRLDFGE